MGLTLKYIKKVLPGYCTESSELDVAEVLVTSFTGMSGIYYSLFSHDLPQAYIVPSVNIGGVDLSSEHMINTIKRIGSRTIEFTEPPSVLSYASVVGKKEGEGPLGGLFDKIICDSYDGLDTYEDAESKLQTEAMTLAMQKGEMKKSDIDLVFAGDLLNQCVGSTFGLKDFKIPYLGQYGACSTMAQNLIAASVFVSSGAAEKAACSTSSHFCSAERQYRYPLEYGSVRTPTAQWTVTGAGCCIIGKDSKRIKISRATVGKIIDLGVTDANNMGAAMAPAMCIIEP